MLKHLRFVSLFTAIHWGLTLVFGICSMAWQMLLLDSASLGQHTAAPFGLSFLNGILIVLSLPILPVLTRGALYLGYADPVSNTIYWLFPPLNSALAALMVVVVKETIIKHRLRSISGDN